jgi:hypothetical protein
MGQNGRPAGGDELILALAARDVASKGRNNAARGNAPGNETITTMDQPRRGAMNGEQWMASRGMRTMPCDVYFAALRLRKRGTNQVPGALPLAMILCPFGATICPAGG